MNLKMSTGPIIHVIYSRTWSYPLRGWCFLENVKSASNPAKGCFKDARYSKRWGRFYSAYACGKSEDDVKYPKYPLLSGKDYGIK